MYIYIYTIVCIYIIHIYLHIIYTPHLVFHSQFCSPISHQVNPSSKLLSGAAEFLGGSYGAPKKPRWCPPDTKTRGKCEFLARKP